MNRLKVLIADDHTMFAQGLQGLLQDEFDLVGRVGDGEALVDQAMRLRPDIIVVDISMPVMNGFDAVRRLRRQGSKAAIIFLTMHGDEGLIKEAFQTGASGYLLKQSAGEELIAAIKTVADGGRYLSPLAGPMPGTATSQDPQIKSLTPRQREVLGLLAEGKSLKQVATALGISTRTAESHKYEMMEQLGIQTNAELIRYAIALGLVKE